MPQNYLDAMPIVRKFGKPDFFITVTANPSWPEITENLRGHETAYSRPDLTARVFHMKLKAILHDLCVNAVLGKPLGYIWVVEFQKRGLPHAHILLIVRSEDKPRCPDDIDARICAELPDPTNPLQVELANIVLSSMIHGPCCARNPNAPCMDGKTCIKGYPKEFATATTLREGGYPSYRRRPDSPSASKGGHPIDARDVVPYNPYLLKKYNCHINVEYCGAIKSVKYVYKYTYKGHDRAGVEMEIDEIKKYLDVRYVGPPEACWRLLEFDMYGKSHVIERLAVHLEGDKTLLYLPGAEKAALENAKLSTLEAWFTLNTADSFATTLRYAEVPEYYRWIKKDVMWQRRSTTATAITAANKVIGRLHSATPSEGERFYLYILLLHVRGVKGWSDLKSVDNHVCKDFREAAEKRGLLESDNEYQLALQEASAVGSGSRVRQLFAYILLHCEVSDAITLWEDNRDAMTEDLRRHHATDEDCINHALSEVQKILTRADQRLETFKLPMPRAFDEARFTNKALYRELNFDHRRGLETAEAMREQMYPQQKRAFDDITTAVREERPFFAFVDGPGGSDKTFLYEAILHYTRAMAGSAWLALGVGSLPCCSSAGAHAILALACRCPCPGMR